MKPRCLLYLAGILLTIFQLTPISSFSQESSKSKSTPPFLLRIERLWQHRDVCMLINRDGAYRMERIFPGKTGISAGTLSDENLQALQHLLNVDQFQNITQDAIGRPLVGEAMDSLTLSVGRSTVVQELVFADERNRLRFRETIDPILKWLDEAQELPGTRLSDSSASKCMPPPRVVSVKLERQYSWIVRFATDEMFVGRAERMCAVIQLTGEFRREQQKQPLGGETVKGKIHSGRLTSAQMEELRSLLDDPNLVKLPSQESTYASRFAEGRFTTVSIPRPGAVQTLVTSSYYKIEYDPTAPGGMAGVHHQIADENPSLRPLLSWVDRNVMKPKLPETANIIADGCRPKP